jgi:hypothetical protein
MQADDNDCQRILELIIMSDINSHKKESKKCNEVCDKCTGRCNECNEICDKRKKIKNSFLPVNKELPFFAYGLFKNGELGFHQIKEFVEKIETCEVVGNLLERDGIPLFERGHRTIRGHLIFFKPNQGVSAYNQISKMEPQKIYSWGNIEANKNSSNILVGKKVNKGASLLEYSTEWIGRKDPYFTDAINEVRSILISVDQKSIRFPSFDDDYDHTTQFRLQMAYLLLWSSIERYASLKYCLDGKSIRSTLKQVAQESAFKEGLKTYVKNTRIVFSSNNLGESALDPNNEIESMDYYYAVRSNSTHRGKSVIKDFDILKNSLEELLNIFELMLKESFKFDESFSSN